MTVAPVAAQPTMFWVPPMLNCDSNASARNAFGTAAEEIVRELLGLERIPINGSFDVCFDAKRGAQYYEIKSTSQKSGKVVLYDWRMGKDVEAGVSLTYVIVCHSINGARKDIITTMLTKPLELLLLPAEIIHELAYQCPIQHLKTELVEGWSDRSGYARDGYKDGYRNLPLTTILRELEWTTTTIENPLGGNEITLKTYSGRTQNNENI